MCWLQWIKGLTMNKQDRVKEYISKIASFNGMTYEEVEELAIVKLVVEYIASDDRIESEGD